eukprot:JP447269.1.p1 GENE.JP447269.1~~JP447269.1.p1  ORF type:complete len:176 (+),score=46.32 JP447269.1:2-529(+)
MAQSTATACLQDIEAFEAELEAAAASMPKVESEKKGFRARLSSLKTKPATGDDEKAVLLLLKGNLLRVLGQEERAELLLRASVDLKASIMEDKYVVPYALYDLAEITFGRGDLPAAADFINRAGSFGGYDWEDPLKVRLRLAADQLKSGGFNVVLEDDESADIPTPHDDADDDED